MANNQQFENQNLDIQISRKSAFLCLSLIAKKEIRKNVQGEHKSKCMKETWKNCKEERNL